MWMKKIYNWEAVFAGGGTYEFKVIMAVNASYDNRGYLGVYYEITIKTNDIPGISSLSTLMLASIGVIYIIYKMREKSSIRVKIN